MSTIVRTPFGNYETYGDEIWDVSPELQEVLDRNFERGDSVASMRRAIQRLQNRYNERLQASNRASERNSIRMQRQMEEMQIRMASDISRAMNLAEESSNRRIEEARRQSRQRLDRLQSDMNTRMSGLREETRQQLSNLRRQQTEALQGLENRVYDDMNNMHRQINSRINGLANNMATIQRDLIGRISTVQENVDRANARIDATNQHVEIVEQGLHQLTDYVGEMEQRIDEKFQEQEQEIRNVQNEVNSIQQRLASIDSRGEERAKMALAWMEEVEQNNNLDRFVPEDANQVRRRMQQLSQIGATGAELSAAANEAIIAAQELEIKCNRERLKFEQKEELTRTMLEGILETVNKLREIQLSDDEGNPVHLENNFWSRGRYQQLLDRLQSLDEEMERRSKTDMTMERLDEIQREIVQAETEIQEITSQSVARVNQSQARIQTISDIIEVMEDQHWQVIEKDGIEEIGYAGGETAADFREGAFARLRNDMGEEVTIVVDPTEDETKNTLGFHYSGGMYDTDEENESKVQTIAEEIEKSGYEVGKPKCAGHMAMPEMDSAEAMTQQGASQRMRERIQRR